MPLRWACGCTIAGPVAQRLNRFPEQTDVQSAPAQVRERLLPLLPLGFWKPAQGCAGGVGGRETVFEKVTTIIE